MAFPDAVMGYQLDYVCSVQGSGASPLLYCYTFEWTTNVEQHRFKPANTIPLRKGEKQGYKLRITGPYVDGQTLPGLGDEIKAAAMTKKVGGTALAGSGIPTDMFNANLWGRMTVTVPPDLKMSRDNPGNWTLEAETGDVTPAAT